MDSMSYWNEELVTDSNCFFDAARFSTGPGAYFRIFPFLDDLVVVLVLPAFGPPGAGMDSSVASTGSSTLKASFAKVLLVSMFE